MLMIIIQSIYLNQSLSLTNNYLSRNHPKTDPVKECAGWVFFSSQSKIRGVNMIDGLVSIYQVLRCPNQYNHIP